MTLTHGKALAISAVVAVATFAVVQDRVTAAGARQYVALQRVAMAEGRQGPSIETVMAPARARAVIEMAAPINSMACQVTIPSPNRPRLRSQGAMATATRNGAAMPASDTAAALVAWARK